MKYSKSISSINPFSRLLGLRGLLVGLVVRGRLLVGGRRGGLQVARGQVIQARGGLVGRSLGVGWGLLVVGWGLVRRRGLGEGRGLLVVQVGGGLVGWGGWRVGSTLLVVGSRGLVGLCRSVGLWSDRVALDRVAGISSRL